VKPPLDSTTAPSNRLLAALPREDYQRLLARIETVRLPRNRILYEAGDEVRCAYFLNDGLVSLLAITEAGQTVDICTIGNEGVVGLPIVLNVPIMPCRVVNQLPCEALRIKSAPLLAEFKRGGTLQRLLLKYAYGQQSQMMQSAVCHSLHSIRERLSRWLLVIGDALKQTVSASPRNILLICWGINVTASHSLRVSYCSKDSLSMAAGA